jgi:hypothetical protein
VRARPVVLLAGGTAYSLVAATTTPFTLPADILTGLAIVVMGVLAIASWPLRTRTVRTGPSSQARAGHPYRPWLVLVGLFTLWELVNYAYGLRAAHPTFSSITDAIDRHYVLKAALFLGWLGLGLVILRQGAGRHRGADRHRGASRPDRPDR